MNTMTKEQAIEKVNGSISTIFSKEDVINILKSIESESYDQKIKWLQSIEKKIIEAIGNIDNTEIVDESSIQLSINYNREIEIDTFDVNYDSLDGAVSYVIEEEISIIEDAKEESQEKENEKKENDNSQN